MLSDQIPRLSPLLLAILASSAANTARAQDDELYFSKLPVVASVSRLAQPLSEAPGAVTVIDSEIIRASGARNLSDLLRLVPGFAVTPPNQNGAIVAYHGLIGEEYTPLVQVLIDGRSQYSPLFKSGVNWNLLPVALEDIERIEVMRGSNTVAYGSNAFLGVINIITQHPALARGWMVSSNHGNQKIDDSSLRWGGRAGNSDIRFTYRQQNDSGLRKLFDNNKWIDPHDSRHNYLLDLRVDTALNDRDELLVNVSHMEDVSQFGRFNNASDPARDRSQNSSAISAEWRRTFSAEEDMRLRFSHASDWSSERYLSTISFTNTANANITFPALIQGGGKSSRSELEFQHTLAPFKNTRLNWGISWQQSGVSSYEQFSTNVWQNRSTARTFGNLEWRPEKSWLFNAGASLEHDSIYGYAVDPRLSASYHLTPDHTLRLVASRAHRTPSLYESRGNTTVSPLSGASHPMDRSYFADPNLQPEKVTTVELGYLGQFKPIRASVDLRFFNESLPNRIVVVPTALPVYAGDDREALNNVQRLALLNGTIYPYGRADASVNLERVSIRGYEQQWRWQPFETTRLLYGHAYTTIYASMDQSQVADFSFNSDISNAGKISRQTRDSAPRHSTSAMLIQQLPYNLEASVMYYKQSFMRWRRNSYTPPFERIDFRLAWAFRSGSQRGEVAYVAQSANHFQYGSRETRIVDEMHWLTLRLDY